MEPTPQIPREDWAAHPNFPAQTLLLGSHENFRILARQVLDLASAHPERAERLFRRWMFAMGSHERYEESKLYPYLSRRWGVSMAPLEAGHEALAERKRAVLDAFERSHEQDRLDRALRDFGDTLRAHLDLEERTVIPLLLELSPDEFADYYALPIRTLLERMSASRSLS